MSDSSNHDDNKNHENEIIEFLTSYGVAVNKKKIRGLLSYSEQKLSSYKINIIISHCCKTMDLDTAVEEYRKAKLQQVHPNNDGMANLLSLAAGLGEQGSGSLPARTQPPPQDMTAAFELFEDMKKRGVKLAEASYTAMIRCCCQNNRSDDGLSLFREMQSFDLIPKLRTFTALLLEFSRLKNEEVCFGLIHEITEKYQYMLTEREYVIMLTLTCEMKDRRFYDILDDMIEDVLVPCEEASWTILRKWFEEEPTIDKSMGEYNVFTCDVDAAGVVTESKDQLRSIEMKNEDALALLQEIDRVASAPEKFVKKHTSPKMVWTGVTAGTTAVAKSVPEAKSNEEDSDKCNGASVADKTMTTASTVTTTTKPKAVPSSGEQKWRKFNQWLSELSQPNHPHSSIPAALGMTTTAQKGAFPYDVLVDGANVGYYKMNYAGAPTHVNYRQIDWVLKHLQSLGYKPLLVLHIRHMYSHVIPEADKDMVEAWFPTFGMKAGGKHTGVVNVDACPMGVYVTPAGSNDDWYWLYAAVTFGCHVVTNDEMRDHHFRMLSPRWFAQWKERHQIRFKLGDWRNKASFTQFNQPNQCNLLEISNPIAIDGDGKDDAAEGKEQQSVGDKRALNGDGQVGDKSMSKAHKVGSTETTVFNTVNSTTSVAISTTTTAGVAEQEYSGVVVKSKVPFHRSNSRAVILSIPPPFSNRTQKSHVGKNIHSYFMPFEGSDKWLCCKFYLR